MFGIKCRIRNVLFVAVLTNLTACGGSGSSGGETSTVQAAENTAQSLTYFAHTREIIDSRCVTCHREGGQAPFNLETYAQVVGKKSAMVFALQNGSMPSAGFAPLSSAERTLLIDWLEDGAHKGSDTGSMGDTPYTYFGHAKAILDDKCANCHTPGEIAPFDLTHYAGARSLRTAIGHQVTTGAMPPWPPTTGYLPLKNDRSLTDREREVLLSWAAGGAPEGDPANYLPPLDDTVKIDYNLRIKINEPFTPRQRPDEYRCLLIDWPLEETVYVDAVKVVPDAKAQVHHVFAVIASPGQLPVFEAADGADGQPGFPCWGAPSPIGALLPPRTLSVWAPGITSGYLPEGTGVKVEPGSKIVMQMHYNTINSEPVPDQSSLDIHYVSAVEREAVTLFFLDVSWYGSGGMPIPANDPNVTVQYTSDMSWAMRFVGADKAGVEADQPFALHSVFMHQHVLGKAASIELIREDGTEIMLVDIQDWDFDWQDEYFFKNEIIVQPEDKFRLTCTWDNTAPNQQFIDGKQIDPQYTEFGEGTTDEMCVNYFYITRATPQDIEQPPSIAPTVVFHQPLQRQIYRPGDYVPIELLVNAFKLQEPHGSHADHGHSGQEGSIDGEHPGHTHRSGHYHIYLDSDDDAAQHLTRWDSSTYFQLPADLPTGEHTLRVSLRSDTHEALGVEDRVTILVEERATPTGGTTALIDVAQWRIASAEEDSLAQHRPAVVDCPENSWYEEDGALEVETGYCNYLALIQPSKAAVRKGDLVRLVLWHGQLRFEEPAEAHVAVTLGDKILWEDQIEIPNAGGIYEIVVPSTVSIAAGEAVEYHLHNHGYNTWTLLSLELSATQRQ